MRRIIHGPHTKFNRSHGLYGFDIGATALRKGELLQAAATRISVPAQGAELLGRGPGFEDQLPRTVVLARR